MDRLVPCPNCTSRYVELGTLHPVKMFSLVDCIRMILASMTSVTCDRCPAEHSSVSLNLLVPDLLLLDVSSLKHMDLATEVG